MKKLRKLVQHKNLTQLNKWICSANIVDQLYALYGYKELEKQGFVVTGKAKEIIEYVKQKRGNVFTCSGCTVEKMEIKEAINYFMKN